MDHDIDPNTHRARRPSPLETVALLHVTTEQVMAIMTKLADTITRIEDRIAEMRSWQNSVLDGEKRSRSAATELGCSSLSAGLKELREHAQCLLETQQALPVLLMSISETQTDRLLERL